MKRLLYLTLITMLFGTLINVIITLNQIQINTATKNILQSVIISQNTTKGVLNSSIKSQEIGLENQHIIINNQKQIFSLSANATKDNMHKLTDMFNNSTNKTIYEIKKILDNKTVR